MLRYFVGVLGFILGVLVSGCAPEKNQPNTITVGTIAGPETTLVQVAKRVALKRYGLHVQIVPFSDYNAPNAALDNGSLDANIFQHLPYLHAQVRSRGYDLVSIGRGFLYPMGIYSRQVHHLTALPKGAKIAIPNDPSNEARALLLLQQAKLIRLKSGVSLNATPMDVMSNPKNLQFVALDAAELPRALQDVAAAVINTNYAVPAGLSTRRDALLVESANSPYANIIVVRRKDRHRKALIELVKAFHSQAVIQEAKRLFGDSAIPAWPH